MMTLGIPSELDATPVKTRAGRPVLTRTLCCRPGDMTETNRAAQREAPSSVGDNTAPTGAGNGRGENSTWARRATMRLVGLYLERDTTSACLTYLFGDSHNMVYARATMKGFYSKIRLIPFFLAAHPSNDGADPPDDIGSQGDQPWHAVAPSPSSPVLCCCVWVKPPASELQASSISSGSPPSLACARTALTKPKRSAARLSRPPLRRRSSPRRPRLPASNRASRRYVGTPGG